MTSLVSQVSPTSNAVNAVMWQDYKGTQYTHSSYGYLHTVAMVTHIHTHYTLIYTTQ